MSVDLLNILKDIRNGNLPPEDVPAFIGWALRKAAWIFIILAVDGVVIAWLMM